MSTSLQARIRASERVRDLAYFLDPLNSKRDRSCSTKAQIMQTIFAKTFSIISFRVRCRFRWEDTPFPADLISRAPGYEPWHEFLKVLVPETGDLINLDLTWDHPLKRAGFRVAQWDGMNSTELAVNPTVIYSIEESRRLIDGNANKHHDAVSEFSKRNFNKLYGPFLDDTNNWLAKQRIGQQTPHA